MKRALLDINLLIALLDATHAFHSRAHACLRPSRKAKAVQAYLARNPSRAFCRDRLTTQLANQVLEAFTRIHHSVQSFIDCSTTMTSADFSVGIVTASRLR